MYEKKMSAEEIIMLVEDFEHEYGEYYHTLLPLVLNEMGYYTLGGVPASKIEDVRTALESRIKKHRDLLRGR